MVDTRTNKAFKATLGSHLKAVVMLNLKSSYGNSFEMQATRTRKVILVHGIFDSSRIFSKFTTQLEENDFHVHTIDLIPSSGLHGLEPLAVQLDKFMKKNVPDGTTASLVAFSMGGIVSRYYLQVLDGISKVHKFISISSPHQGTYTGYLLPFKGCRQMRPYSKFIKELNADIHKLESTDPLSIWTKYDLTIIPPKNSIMRIGKNCQIPIFPHRYMAISKKVSDVVIDNLNRALKTDVA